MGIVDLPDDILLLVAESLSVRDVLALRQTCRVLHAFGSTDYLWHRLADRSDLLFDIPADTPKTDLTADELQRLAIKAIRLQLNWRRPSSRIKRTTTLATTSDALFELMLLLPGAQWLLTVQGRSRQFENRTYTHISLWALADIQRAHCVIQFELMGKHRDTAVTMRDGGSAATFVVALHDGSGDFMHIRTVAVDEYVFDAMSPSPSVLVSRRLAIPPLPEGDRPSTMLVEAVSVSERTLVATVARIIPGQEITSRILIADTDVGPARWMQSKALQPLALPQARIQDERIVVFGRNNGDFIVRVYGLPSNIIRRRCGQSQKFSLFAAGPRSSLEAADDVAWGPLLSQLQLPLGTSLVDSIFVPHHFTSALTVFVLDDRVENKRVGRILRFFLDDKTAVAHSASVFIPPETSVRLAGIGVTGSRAVWMEHSLETTRSRLMKLEFGRTAKGEVEVFHGVLLPPDPPLPFSTDACHMLAFDEATCRLCLGLWDGSLRVVDFL